MSKDDEPLFNYKMQYIGGVEGEVASKTTTNIVVRKDRTDFIKFFIERSPLLQDANLRKSEELILSQILESWIRDTNRVEISTLLRKSLSQRLNYSLSTVYKVLDGLKSKAIFIEKKGDENAMEGSFYLNPHIFS